MTNLTEVWKGQFGNNYINRNDDQSMVENNKWFFIKALKRAMGVKSFLELGANVGLNIKALRPMYKDAVFMAIEVNGLAFKFLSSIPNIVCKNQSLLDDFLFKADLVFTKGVLIHIAPDDLDGAYEQIYNASNKYILIAEYFSDQPTMVSYRGHNDMLFKRDFGGDLMDKYDDLILLDYGFSYKRDIFPQDSLNWWLFQKRGVDSEESGGGLPDTESVDAHSKQMETETT